MEKLKKNARVILYNLLVVFLFFSCIEFGIALLLRNPQFIPGSLLDEFRNYYNESDRQIIQFNPSNVAYDSSLYYIFKPGKFKFSNREFESTCSINSKGLRDDDSSLIHPSIISLGDSYTMGWGVEQDESFPEQLEKKIGRKVLNAGVSSYGTARELKLLEQLNTDSLRYIILQYCTNDKDENNSYLHHENKLIVSSKESFSKVTADYLSNLKYYPFKHLYKMSGIIHNIILKGRQPGIEEWPPQQIRSVFSDHAIKFLSVMNNFQSLPDSVPVIVLCLDSYTCSPYFTDAVEREIKSDEFSKLKSRIKLLDLSKIISDDEFYRLDGHLKPQAHEKIADAIYQLIRSNSRQ